MNKSLRDKLNSLPENRQAKIKERANDLIAHEMTLRDLRKALHLTQVQIAQLLDTNQEAVSRMERRADLLLSTLSAYIASMGGKLKLIAEFPNRPTVTLIGFTDLEQKC